MKGVGDWLLVIGYWGLEIDHSLWLTSLQSRFYKPPFYPLFFGARSV